MPAWMQVLAAVAGLLAVPFVVRSVLAEMWERDQERTGWSTRRRIVERHTSGTRAVTNGGQR